MLKVGDIVKYREALEPGDEDARFVLVELNGDRCFIKAICDLPLPPVSLRLTAEIVAVDQ